MEKQRGFTQIILIVAAVVALLAGAFYFMPKNQTSPSNNLTGNQQSFTEEQTGTTVSVPTVKSPQDLTAVSNDLDNTNVDSINNDLSQNDTDASNF